MSENVPEFTNNPDRSNKLHITFKALEIEPDYMQESNPEGPAPLSVLFRRILGIEGRS
jgi:hypothetical protein